MLRLSACILAIAACELAAARGLEEYEPCLDKAEGDSCTLCSPSDVDCIETMMLKVCVAGECTGVSTPTDDDEEEEAAGACECGWTSTYPCPGTPRGAGGRGRRRRRLRLLQLLLPQVPSVRAARTSRASAHAALRLRDGLRVDRPPPLPRHAQEVLADLCDR